MVKSEFAAILLLGCVLSEISTAQRNRFVPAKPYKSPDGKWRPTRRRVTVNRRPINTGSRNRPALNLNTLITPPIRLSRGQKPPEEPKWVHCVNSIEVSSNWATINNPGYPEAIGGQLQCTWNFYGASGYRLRISFHDFDLQAGNAGRCASQFVDVIDTEAKKSQGRFCGNKIPGDYVTLGNQLRVDIQADHSVVKHKGFMASVRMEPRSVLPGMRRRSLRYHGPVTTTTRPPARIRFTTRRRQAPIPATTEKLPTPNRNTRSRGNIGQNIYGQNFQPPRVQTDSKPTNGLSTGEYAAIVIGCLLIIVIGLACVFRKSIYEKIQRWRGKETHFKQDENVQNTNQQGSYYDEKFSLPGNPLPYEPEVVLDRRRRSVIFEDEYLTALEEERRRREANAQFIYDENIDELDRCEVVPDYPTDQWNAYYHSESGFEDDTSSVRSMDSVRSSMRHPEHAHLKRKKIIELANSRIRAEDELTTESETTDYGQPRFHAPPPYVMHPFYDDKIEMHPRQDAMMPYHLRASQSMTDISRLDNNEKVGYIPRTMSMNELPRDEDVLPYGQLQRRQSFYT